MERLVMPGATFNGGAALIKSVRKLADSVGPAGRLALYNLAGRHMVVTEIPLIFREEGPGWKPLKYRRGKILQDTGRLRDSITYRATMNDLVIGTKVRYGGYHQYGAPKAHVQKRAYLKFTTRALAAIKRLWLRSVGPK